jgi:hypothetical protein
VPFLEAQTRNANIAAAADRAQHAAFGGKGTPASLLLLLLPMQSGGRKIDIASRPIGRHFTLSQAVQVLHEREPRRSSFVVFFSFVRGKEDGQSDVALFRHDKDAGFFDSPRCCSRAVARFAFRLG